MFLPLQMLTQFLIVTCTRKTILHCDMRSSGSLIHLLYYQSESLPEQSNLMIIVSNEALPLPRAISGQRGLAWTIPVHNVHLSVLWCMLIVFHHLQDNCVGLFTLNEQKKLKNEKSICHLLNDEHERFMFFNCACLLSLNMNKDRNPIF
uniref:Uncharacterized protein LOC104236145 n=1 Tax=Nicotiana sylvestris TaxID=4096 RepID=A0A1U7X887_NICSY|nr:PREDICTED: uncharacterized protein LOC104236145 [Nicotiana sylvestris]